MVYKAHDGQSFFDVALQNYGDVSMCVQLLVDNPSLDSLNNSSFAGKSLLVSQNLIKDFALFNYIRRNQIFFNTITPIFIPGNYYSDNNNRITEDGNERITEDGQTIIID